MQRSVARLRAPHEKASAVPSRSAGIAEPAPPRAFELCAAEAGPGFSCDHPSGFGPECPPAELPPSAHRAPRSPEWAPARWTSRSAAGGGHRGAADGQCADRPDMGPQTMVGFSTVRIYARANPATCLTPSPKLKHSAFRKVSVVRKVSEMRQIGPTCSRNASDRALEECPPRTWC